jgi:nucleotide-binding universal stress UspA family protein
MTDPIVVGVDGSGRSLRALMWAAHDASLHGCPLRVVHALPHWEHDVPLHPPGTWLTVAGRATDVVNEAVDMAAQAYPELEVTSDLKEGTPTNVLREESQHARAVVVGARGEGGVGNLLLGSVSLQLVGHAASPVVVVGYITTGHKRVVVGTDGSANSYSALEFAFDEAEARGAALRVVRAWSMPAGPHKTDEIEASREERREELSRQLGRLKDDHPKVTVEESLLREAAAPALVRASERADLVVVGSRGRGGFHGLALGSTGHKVLDYTFCPVAVVRPRPEPTG